MRPSSLNIRAYSSLGASLPISFRNTTFDGKYLMVVVHPPDQATPTFCATPLSILFEDAIKSDPWA